MRLLLVLAVAACGSSPRDAGASDAPDATPPPPVYCGHPADCAGGRACAPAGTCQAGDCNAGGCVFGYTCQPDGTCAPSRAGAACDRDRDCAPGVACLAGVCTSTDGRCVDQSQCDAGERCADGRCVVGCRGDADCRDGFRCNTTLGLCSLAVETCTITNDCGGPDAVCAAGSCVPRSAGGACPNAGDVWFENGCVPDPAPHFTCTTDGVRDACVTGSICLDHDCWISCDAPNQNACANLPVLNKCKPLTSSSGTHDVCATSGNLGGECSAAAPCGAGTCIDGFCR